ncbi:MAG: LacI family DNA-binding transcriptional regulator [Phycisphaeraceae bacterium]
MTKKPIQLADVARHANVGVSTVSMALRDDPRIAVKTREKVRAAVRALGYEPTANMEARRMGARRAGRAMPYRTLGLLWTASQEHSMVQTSFYRALLDGVVDACWQVKHTLLLMNLAGESREEFAALSQVDGVILPQSNRTCMQMAQTLGRPVVTILRGEPTEDEPRINVGIDDAEAVRLAFEHLHTQGHRRIGYIGPKADPLHGKRRHEAFEACRARHGLSGEGELVALGEGLPWRENAARCLRTLMRRPSPPTGVVVYNDMMALGALEAAQELGVRVPADLSMVSIDDVREAAETDPPLTTVSIQIEELGRQAARALAAVVEGRPPAERDIRVPVVLKARASTAAPRAET